MSMVRMWVMQRRGIASAEWFQHNVREMYSTRLIESAKSYRNPVGSLQLKEIDDRFLLFRPGRLVVDFGCSPGGWSAVAFERCHKKKTNNHEFNVIGVDRKGMDPITGVYYLNGVVGEKDTLQRLLKILKGRKADVVISDMAPELSADVKKDKRRQSMVSLIASEAAEEIIKPGGSFVCRALKSADLAEFRLFLRSRFENVATHFSRKMSPKLLSERFASDEFIVDDNIFAFPPSKHVYLIGQNFIGRHSLITETQVKGGFDPRDGKLGEATTDLLNPTDNKLEHV